ncbi:MAG: D-alanyl-D-alanine carboxypeptidase/D-alanyl-D-alanine-endopeptidase [Candidatus Marinimicrobia bacterium]|jgi:D-alanyl-D-alanine carboxypeptidase/D-alanyl-D-alanine-endopeptidase (penicillin-binding protein 4)|nr:D-alanyl-D-alanine carboxypeptidase/D-alanyl-D-alanine-endopeptidase [Candidatus Neomarinimicrobiota bacterium]MBT3796773.1 D-alanyl-D-alanine carboxypeptidase/D-alanyl-D-alanine-endopeptidase [Candidatus Neomarinimicrobiota bacterium]MBT4317550.1 D-alanyl-D-alanine carboxypeptidase/D-alanyl-D-alanine-endopeptidase [Candidatus Neomarinimicrobiota bacterium]MBT4784051.1 D-alanyl-D-alanine carboxypeptidase/D-alanyl-D-alanine-endopeptidase [Candidatus Neomarinimicrobiota bacterium]MBT5440181.1 
MNKLKYTSIIVFFISCTQSPIIYTSVGKLSLKKKISSIINESKINTNIGIKAISLTSGKTLFDLNSNSLFNPASNNKLYTGLSALSLLDSNYTFNTNLYYDDNKLYLQGGGDPDLSLRSLDSLATIISKMDLEIEQLILDDTRMDSTTYGQGWMWDEGAWWYSAQVSALSVNDNCVDFIISPGLLGKPAKIKTIPQSNYFKIINNSITTNDISNFMKFEINRDWKNNTNSFTVSGNILSISDNDTLFRNIHDPTQFTGHLFQQMLFEKGKKINSINKGPVTENAKLITSHKSKKLIPIIENLMVKSDNLTAELLIKTIGFEANKKEGNWKNGLEEVRKFINDSVGIDTATFSIQDGSGVSRYNYGSPSQYIDLLKWVYNNKAIRDQFINTLPNSTPKGVLNKRSLPNKVYAKTGSLSGVTTFSGYIFTNSGEIVAFSILMNGFKGDSLPYKNLQDKIVSALSMI